MDLTIHLESFRWWLKGDESEGFLDYHCIAQNLLINKQTRKSSFLSVFGDYWKILSLSCLFRCLWYTWSCFSEVTTFSSYYLIVWLLAKGTRYETILSSFHLNTSWLVGVNCFEPIVFWFWKTFLFIIHSSWFNFWRLICLPLE